MTGHTVKRRAGMDPCRPSCPSPDCTTCARFDVRLPDDAEQRPRTVLLDASVIRVQSQLCRLHVRLPIAGFRFGRSAQETRS